MNHGQEQILIPQPRIQVFSCHPLTTQSFQLLCVKELRTQNYENENPREKKWKTGLYLTTVADPKPRKPQGSDLKFLSALVAQPWDQAAQIQVTDFDPDMPPPQWAFAYSLWKLQNSYFSISWKISAACFVGQLVPGSCSTDRIHDNGWHLEQRGGSSGASASSGPINLFVLFGLISVSYI